MFKSAVLLKLLGIRSPDETRWEIAALAILLGNLLLLQSR